MTKEQSKNTKAAVEEAAAAEAAAAEAAAAAETKQQAKDDARAKLVDTINFIGLQAGFGPAHVIAALAAQKIKVTTKKAADDYTRISILNVETLARGDMAEALTTWCQAARRKLAGM